MYDNECDLGRAGWWHGLRLQMAHRRARNRRRRARTGQRRLAIPAHRHGSAYRRLRGLAHGNRIVCGEPTALYGPHVYVCVYIYVEYMYIHTYVNETLILLDQGPGKEKGIGP